MRTQQGLVRLPEELVRRLKRQVLAPARSAFLQRLIEEALPAEDGNDDPFYQVACAVERDERLADEMADWDATIDDGLEATKVHAREPAFIGSATRAARRSLAGQSGPGPRRRDPQDAPGCGGDGGRVESGAANSRVVPLSTGLTPRPPVVVATPSAGNDSVAVCDQVRAVDKARLIHWISKLAAGDLRAVEDGVRVVPEPTIGAA